MKIKFSIIIPTFNGELFLKRCINSILKQSYKNFEVIVMDGGSTDSTLKILKSFGNNIKYYSQKDKGQADAINKGISKSTGTWITWQNCDDFYSDPNAFLEFANAIKSHSSKKLFIANINLINFDEKILRDIKYFKPSFTSLLYEGMTLTNQACFWNKDLNQKLGYLKNLRINFDYEWFLRILKNYPNSGFHIDKTLGCFRIHKHQKTQNQNIKDYKHLIDIKMQYGYNKNYSIIIKFLLLIRKSIYHFFQGNFYYLLRGFFKFFFGVKNKEYIDN
jgi:glycosyltransferase involved in cell wall biosynthesis